MGKPIDDTELCAKVADELVMFETAPVVPPRTKGNVALAVRLAASLRAYDEPALTRRIQKRFKANGTTYMRDAIDRRAARLRSEQRALTKLRASLS